MCQVTWLAGVTILAGQPWITETKESSLRTGAAEAYTLQWISKAKSSISDPP